MDNTFSLQEIFTAYKRLKNHYYYDSNNLYIRAKIAEFEQSFGLTKTTQINKAKKKIEKAFEPLTTFLNTANSQADLNEVKELPPFKTWLDGIGVRVLPKKVSVRNEPTSEEGKNEETKVKKQMRFFTNMLVEDTVKVQQCNFMIEAPVWLHLISVLWTERVGLNLYPSICKNNYAYHLNVKSESDKSLKQSESLFTPYFIGYQQWRDKPLEVAKEMVEKGNDVSILSLDIKRYYYSVRLDIREMVTKYAEKALDDEKCNLLNTLLQAIHEAYHEKLKPYIQNEAIEEVAHRTVLPVGLMSSGLLANVYLNEFDELIETKVHPTYYGRYVDDMIFVFCNRKVHADAKNPVKQFVEENFCSVKALCEKGDEYCVQFAKSKEEQTSLVVQQEKIILEHFDHNGSLAAINIFMRNLSQQRSEFRFLPNEEMTNSEFDDEAFQLLYCDSANKIRNIRDFKEDKFGAAKYLARIIFLARLSYDKKDKIQLLIARQILSFFSGANAISMFTLWERAASYFVLTENKRALSKLYYNIVQAIGHIELHGEDNNGINPEDLSASLNDTLKNAFAMPLALCSAGMLELLKDGFSDDVWASLLEMSKFYRLSNMFRGAYIGVLGINLTDAIFNEKISLYSDREMISPAGHNTVVCLLYPKHIHFEELNMLAVHKSVQSRQKPQSPYTSLKRMFRELPVRWLYLFKEQLRETKIAYSPLKIKGQNVVIADGIELGDVTPNKKIALVNERVNLKDFMQVVMWRKENLSKDRREDLMRLINEAHRNNADIMVMPELSIPFGWLSALMLQSAKMLMAIITGLEYTSTNKTIKNFVATILPFRSTQLKGSVTILREKNFLSPGESTLLQGYHYTVSNIIPPEYHLFHWRKVYFSVYNCFELADIESRKLFKSKADFIVAVEYNRDTNYFADVVSSWARDIHCYVIQDNSSDFGDSKIIRPSKTGQKTIVQVKGGDNGAVLTAALDIDSLRDFQWGNYLLQKDNKKFKFTPPSFNHENVRKRKEDEDF